MNEIDIPLIILSAPSGAGKNTVIDGLLQCLPQLSFCISTTTRVPRKGEQHGCEYYFTSKNEFQRNIEEGIFLEWALVHGNYYGTSRKELNRIQMKNKLPILDIDVQGMLKIRKKKTHIITIFIEPPSLDVLRERLLNRATDTQEVIEERVKNAEEELSYKPEYDYIVVNDVLETTIQEIVIILQKHLNNQS